MRLSLINPSNPLVSIVRIKESRWNRFRVWKPLSLMVLAGLTPPEWEITIVDENLGVPDYSAMPRPDLVGITAFTSQANRAYDVAAQFRRLGVWQRRAPLIATLGALSYRSNLRLNSLAYAQFKRQQGYRFTGRLDAPGS